MRPLAVIAMLCLLVAGCGVKNDLAKPNGQVTSAKDKDVPDPSRPAYPLGR